MARNSRTPGINTHTHILAFVKHSSDAISNMKVVGVAQIVVVTLNQIATLIVARVLVPNDFGIYAACLVFINMAGFLSTFGLDAALINRQAGVERAFETASTVRFVLACLAALIFFVASPWVADLMRLPDLLDPLRVSSLAFVISALGFESSTRLSKNLQFIPLSVTKIVNSVAWSVGALVLAYLGWGKWSLIFAYFVGTMSMIAALWFFQPWKIRHRLDARLLRELLRYGVFVAGTGVFAFLVWNLDKIAVGAVLADSALLGVYWIAVNYGTIIPNLFTGVVTGVLFPTFSSVQQDKEKVRRSYLLALKYLGYISIPIGVGLAATSETLIRILFGPQWIQAATPMALFSIVGILGSLTSPAGSVFLATGNPHKMFVQTVGTAIPFLVFLVPAVYYGGLVGVALLFFATALAALIWVFLMVSEILHFSTLKEFRALLAPLGASIGIVAVCIVVRIELGVTLLALVTEVALAVAAYALLISLFTKGQAIRDVRGLLSRRSSDH